MIVLVIVSFFALFFTFYASRDEIPYGLEIAFLLLTFVAAIHYNYGNDYNNYLLTFEKITQYDFSISGLLNQTFYKESGWALLCFLFKPVGFLWMVVFLSIIENLAYYIFVRFYVPKNWWILGIFIYVSSKYLYILNMSMLRQGLTVALFVLIWPLIKSKNVLKIVVSLFIVWIASTIHSSAWILLPFVLFGFIPMNNGRVIGVILFVLFFVLFFNIELLNQTMMQFSDIEELERYFEKYQNNEAHTKFGIGFILLTIPFFVSLFFLLFNKSATIEEKQIITIASVGSLIIPFIQIFSIVGRMGYYFAPFTIASIPITYRWIACPWKYFFVFLFVFISCYDYWLFFHSDIFAKCYLTFHSIFEVIF